MMAFAFAVITISSCRSARYTSDGTSAEEIIASYTGSYNELDMEVGTDPIYYTIDISTPEGAAKLNNLSFQEAKGLALREAVMKYRCAKIVNPQYTKLMKGKRVLRVTVYGFPAKYKNQEKPQYDSRTRQEIDINVRR